MITARTIHGGDPPSPTSTAVVMDGGLISWVGPVDQAPPRTDRVDLGDVVVIPGFVDSHIHVLSFLVSVVGVDLRGARSTTEAAALLRAHAARTAGDGWVVGWGFDAARAGGRRLKRADLDAIAEDRPAFVIESSLHQGSANSAALAAVGWGRHTPRWPGGELQRDRRGEPTGVVWERASAVILSKVLDAALASAEADPVGLLRAAEDTVLSEGVTHIAEAFTPPWAADLFRSANLSVGVTMLMTSGRSLLAAPFDALDGPKTGEGDARLGFGPVKLVADGAERGAMCLSIPQTVRLTGRVLTGALRRRDATPLRLLGATGSRLRGTRVLSGISHYSREGLADILRTALERGFGVAVHAIGNQAVDDALHALEQGRAVTGADLSGCRIEHAMFADRQQLERAARLGVMLSMQPGHATIYAPTIRMLATDRYFEPVPIRWAIDAGCRVAISSDAPTRPGTALDDLRAAVDRMGTDGHPVAPTQAITRSEALRAATVGGAEACGVDSVKGSIAPGKQADFAVLSGDPFDPATRVLETWIAGRKVWPR